MSVGVLRCSQNPLRPPSGFTDYSMAENQAFDYLKTRVAEVFKRYGFSAFYPSPVERIQILREKGGINKQIYSIFSTDEKNNDIPTGLGLPFDRTVSLALYIARNFRELAFPFKRYDISYSFRGEHAQKGRYRGFYQADIDVVGKNLSIDADVECVSTIFDALTKLKIGPFVMAVNNIKLAKAILEYFKIEEAKKPDVLRILDKMDKLSMEDIENELSEIIVRSTAKDLLQIVSFKGSINDYCKMLEEKNKDLLVFCKTAIEEISLFIQKLEESGVDLKQINFCPRMVRGLDYYTGMVFETFLVGKEKYGSIASGGRYAELVDAFLKDKTGLEGTGISIGLTRLFDICVREKLIPLGPSTQSHVLIAFKNDAFRSSVNVIGHYLREKDLNVDIYLGNKEMKAQLGYANTLKIPFVILVVDNGKYVVKNMKRKTQSEELTSIEQVFECLEQMKKEEITQE